MKHEHTLIIRDNDSRNGDFLDIMAFRNGEMRDKAIELIHETIRKYPGDWTMEDVYEAWDKAKLDYKSILGGYEEIWI